MTQLERINRAFLQLRCEGVVKTQKDLANKINMPAPNLSKALKGDKMYFTDGFVLRFTNAFDNIINRSWLLTGEGPMLASEAQQQASIDNEKGEVLKVPIHGAATQNNTNSPHSVMFAQNVSVQNKNTANDVEVETIAEGYHPVIPLALTKKPNIDVLATLRNEKMQGVEYLNCASLFADVDAFFRVEDEAMSPYFQKSDLVALCELQKGAFIINGNAYVVDTKSNGLIFRILIEKEQNLECHALGNTDRYVTFLIPKEQIYRIFKVMGIIRACV